MLIYNTLTRKKDELKPVKAGEVGIYVCGPTVYNFIHIGNARPLCVFDTLRRYLEYRGYKVKYVQNITDVEDKIILRANQRGISTTELAEKYTASYFEMDYILKYLSSVFLVLFRYVFLSTLLLAYLNKSF